MNKSKSLCNVMTALCAASIALLCGGEPAKAQLPSLTTSGNHIMQNGQPYMLAGIGLSCNAGIGQPYMNWSDTTAYDGGNYGRCLSYIEQAADLVTTQGNLYGTGHGWGARVIRLGFSPDWFDSPDSSNGQFDGANFDWYKMAAFVDNVVAPFVSYCQSKNIYVILDTGYTCDVNYYMLQPDQSQYGQSHTNGAIWKIWDYITNPADDTYQKAQGSTAYYQHMNLRNSPNAIYELFNEPNNVSVNGYWTGGDPNGWAQYVNLIGYVVSTVRGRTGNLMLIGGLGEATQLNNIPGNPVPGNNIAYVAHIYPGGTYGHGSSPSDVVNNLNASYQSCASKFPVVVTEFNWFADGSHNDGNGTGYEAGNTDIFGNGLQQWVNANAAGYTDWTIGEQLGTGSNGQRFNLNSGSLDSNSEDYGQFTYQWLWNTTGGNIVNGSIPNGTYSIRNQYGLTIDDYGYSTLLGAPLGQWSFNGGPNQDWQVTNMGGGLYQFKNVYAGMVLDAAGAGGQGTWTQLYTAGNNQSNQLWTLRATGNGYYEISPSYNSGLALDDYGGGGGLYNPSNNQGRIGLWSWNGGPGQQWSFQAP